MYSFVNFLNHITTKFFKYQSLFYRFNKNFETNYKNYVNQVDVFKIRLFLGLFCLNVFEIICLIGIIKLN